MRVFIHISDDSLYLGCGGTRSQVHLANACVEMDYDTYVFGQRDRLTWDKFDWLSWPSLRFDIALRYSLSKQKGEFRIVSSWLNRLMVGQDSLMEDIPLENLRYLERDEIAREKYRSTASFIQSHFDTVGITNRELVKYYGFKEMIPLENWFRRDLFYYTPRKKIPWSIGFQGSQKPQYQELETWGRAPLIRCEGNQARVAGRMRRCEFFIYANPPKRSITLYSGEGFGNALYEAMACGCIVLAMKHNGTAYLKDTIPLVHDVSEAITLIKILSEQKKQQIREKSLALVEERFRLNDEKKRNIGRFLE